MRNKYKTSTIEEVSRYLGNGFNSSEIAKKMNLHPVTIRQIKLLLKLRYNDGER